MTPEITEADIRKELNNALTEIVVLPNKDLCENYVKKALDGSGLKYQYDRTTRDIIFPCGEDCHVSLTWNPKGFYSPKLHMKYDGKSVESKALGLDTYSQIAPGMLAYVVPLINNCIKRLNIIQRNCKERAVGLNLREVIKNYMKQNNITKVTVDIISGTGGDVCIKKLIIPNLKLRITVNKKDYKKRLLKFATVVRQFEDLFKVFPKDIAKVSAWRERYQDQTPREFLTGDMIRAYANRQYNEISVLSNHFKEVEDLDQLCEEMRQLADYCISKGIKYGVRERRDGVALVMVFSPRRAICYQKIDGEWCLYVMARQLYGGFSVSDDMDNHHNMFNQYLKCNPNEALKWFSFFPDNLDFLSQLNDTTTTIGFFRFALAKKYLDDEVEIDNAVIKFRTIGERWIELRTWEMTGTPEDTIALFKTFSTKNQEKIMSLMREVEDAPYISIESMCPNVDNKFVIKQTSLKP